MNEMYFSSVVNVNMSSNKKFSKKDTSILSSNKNDYITDKFLYLKFVCLSVIDNSF